MIRFVNGNLLEGNLPKAFAYSQSGPLFARVMLRVTRFLRAKNASRYIWREGRLLDVGCGDGYFLKLIQFPECYGFDELLSDRWDDLEQFEDHFFSYVTMLAVIEHLANPRMLNSHLWRILRPGGRLIITTPVRAARHLIRLYAPSVEKEHKTYYGLNALNTLLYGRYSLITYRKFAFGLNQVFCYSRLP